MRLFILCFLVICLISAEETFGAGAIPDPQSYAVAAYFEDPRYYYCDAIRWADTGIVSKKYKIEQEFLVIGASGDIWYFRFIEKEPGASAQLLTKKYFELVNEYHVNLDVQYVFELRDAILSMSEGGRGLKEIASTWDVISVSTPGAPGVAYTEKEVRAMSRVELHEEKNGFDELRNAMKDRAPTKKIIEVCARYWPKPTALKKAPEKGI